MPKPGRFVHFFGLFSKTEQYKELTVTETVSDYTGGGSTPKITTKTYTREENNQIIMVAFILSGMGVLVSILDIALVLAKEEFTLSPVPRIDILCMLKQQSPMING